MHITIVNFGPVLADETQDFGENRVCAVLSNSTVDEWVLQPLYLLPDVLDGEFSLQSKGLKYFSVWHIQRRCIGSDSRKMCDQLVIRPLSEYPLPLPNGSFNIVYSPKSPTYLPINITFDFGKSLKF